MIFNENTLLSNKNKSAKSPIIQQGEAGQKLKLMSLLKGLWNLWIAWQTLSYLQCPFVCSLAAIIRITEQDILSSIIYFVFILFKTKYFLSVGKHVICKFSYWAVDFFSDSSNMDRSINSTCNKQTIASEISISNVSFVQSRLEIIFRRVAMLRGGERQSRNNYI